MAEVRVVIPTMLASLVRGERRFTVEATNVEGAVAALFERHPELRVHLLDEQSNVRPHVMFFHNEDAVGSFDASVSDGDTLTVLQAVSGG